MTQCQWYLPNESSKHYTTTWRSRLAARHRKIFHRCCHLTTFDILSVFGSHIVTTELNASGQRKLLLKNMDTARTSHNRSRSQSPEKRRATRCLWRENQSSPSHFGENSPVYVTAVLPLELTEIVLGHSSSAKPFYPHFPLLTEEHRQRLDLQDDTKALKMQHLLQRLLD